MLRALTAAAMWSSGLAAALASGPPIVTAGDQSGSCKGVKAIASQTASRADPATARSGDPEGAAGAGSTGGGPFYRLAAAKDCEECSVRAHETQGMSRFQLAQFQLPQSAPQSTTEGGISPKYPYRPLTQHLQYQYAIGSESEIDYRRNRDLNSAVKDNSLIVVPQVNGYIVYRPTNWLAGTLELTFDKEFAVQEEHRVTLPSGEIQFAPSRRPSLLVDQAFLTIREVTGPFELNVGRRNYEDERHWLYDTSMDIGGAQLRLGHFRAEATAGREVAWDLDLLRNQPRDRINTYMLYADYRGIEDLKLAAYTVRRNDLGKSEGRPLHIGARVLGTPSDYFNYWAELALVRGMDESSRRFSAHGFDVGFTYRFAVPPLNPSITLGYAFGTGDDNPDDGSNHEFRQTGLQTNEEKFAGVSKFKYYGEALDPELSNLKILTIGVGFRPARNVTVDLVYHRYRSHKLAAELRNSALTALMNQDEARPSKDVGSALDIVIGIRRLFGIRRLGVDLRAGWFFPGDAFRILGGDPGEPAFRPAKKGVGVVAKFWY